MNIYNPNSQPIRVCELPGCDNPIFGKPYWVKYCCKSHQAKYAAKKRVQFRESKSLLEKKASSRHSTTKHRKGIRIPAWVKEEEIKDLYRKAVQLTLETGIKHEVDHIDPIKHDLVCGLHCPANLQVITQSENRIKRNKWIPYEIIF